MNKIIENIKGGFVFGLSAFLIFTLSGIVYSALSGEWKEPDLLEKQEGNYLTSDDWNETQTNIMLLKDNISLLEQTVNSSVDTINTLSTKVNSTISSSIGYNQTRQDLTASRALGTTYTNTTGKPIHVCIYGYLETGGLSMQIYVDGMEVNSHWNGHTSIGANTMTSCGIVPPGSTYIGHHGNLAPSTMRWKELR